ncbi:hypothetical protein [uncultured Methylobacterium sp.]|uniref:hypothetical protein n=1 Tax=uncultured Methylobacterium sp. TaxID=157278 RepID=UPI0035CAACD2
MTSWRTLAACASLAFASVSGQGTGLAQGLGAERSTDRTYVLGRAGWSLERFGADIAILRADVTPDRAGAGPPGLLVLSCDAGERRWRLALPESLQARQGHATSATMLLQVAKPAGAYRVTRIGIAGSRVLTVTETGPPNDGFVPFFVRLLKAGTHRLDLLLKVQGAKPSTVLAAYILSPIVQRTDLVAFDDFLATCTAVPR